MLPYSVPFEGASVGKQSSQTKWVAPVVLVIDVVYGRVFNVSINPQKMLVDLFLSKR
jgi:hypothetical protein